MSGGFEHYNDLSRSIKSGKNSYQAERLLESQESLCSVDFVVKRGVREHFQQYFSDFLTLILFLCLISI